MSKNNSSTGVGFTSLLLLTFIILKLCKVIDWNWWWVLSPFWIPLSIAFIGVVIYVIIKVVKVSNKPDVPAPKSAWEKRMEEMKEQQRKMNEMRNNNS